jgi:hypothetical protein
MDRAVYEIMLKNLVEPCRPQMTIWRIHITFWITKDTNSDSEYVIFIDFQLQQWLHERTSVLRCRYIACLVCCIIMHEYKNNV